MGVGDSSGEGQSSVSPTYDYTLVSLDGFTRYEIIGQKMQDAFKKLDAEKNSEDSTINELERGGGWDSIISGQLLELLSDALTATFLGAMTNLVNIGHTQHVSEWAVFEGVGLFNGSSTDAVSHVVDGALAFLNLNKHFKMPKYSVIGEGLQGLVGLTLYEMFRIVLDLRPTLTFTESMWCLLVSELNLATACGYRDSLPKAFGEGLVGSDPKSDNEPSPSELGNKNSLSIQEMNVKDLLRQKALHFEKYYKGRLTNGAFKEKVPTWESLVPKKSLKKQYNTSLIFKEMYYDDVYNTNSTAVKGPVIALPAANSDPRPKIGKNDGPDSLKQPNDFYTKIPFDDILKIHAEQDNRDKALLMKQFKLGLEKELKGWTAWVSENIMEATRTLAKYKAESKTLRQEMAEMEKAKKEHQAGEELNVKRLTDMECVLANANRKVEVGNGAIIRMEVENSLVKRQIEEARLEVIAVGVRVEKASMWERELGRKLAEGQRERSLDVEMMNSTRRRVAELEKRKGKAGNSKNQFKVLQKQVLKENAKIENQYTVLRAKREKDDFLREAESDNILQTGQKRIQKFKDESKNLSSMISEWKLESDKSTIAADPEMECVMCMNAEIVVTFLPCSHQLLCRECNDLHERQGVRDCPSCRATIGRRVSVSYRAN